jgi:hypothetical protein
MKGMDILGLIFLGDLNPVDFYNSSFDEQQKRLVELEIYIPKKTDLHFVLSNLNDWNIDFITKPFYLVQNQNLSTENIQYNGIDYILNPLLIEDIYANIRSNVLNSSYRYKGGKDLDKEKKTILLQSSKLLSNSEIQDFYKLEYNRIFDEIKKDADFLIFEEQGEDDFWDWKSHTKAKIRFNSALIKEHIFSKYMLYKGFSELERNWDNLHFSTEMMNFLKAKIKEYQTEPVSSKAIDTSLQVLLIEEILNIKDKWTHLSALKKAVIVSHITGKNQKNIQQAFLEMDKKKSENSAKFIRDNDKASEIVKNVIESIDVAIV